MNSSGIKRGLATAAVSALAVTGVPFIATSASAASTDEMTVVKVGPFRDGGNVGGLVVLQVKGVAHSDVALASATDITKAADNPASQTVAITDSRDLTADEAKAYGIATGYTGIAVQVSADTRSAGDAVSFALYDDEDGGAADRTGAAAPDVDINEKYVNVQGTTAGAPTSVTVSPALQSTAANVSSGDYTVAVFDAQGRATQLNAAVAAVVGPPAVPGVLGERVVLDNQSATARITVPGTAEGAPSANGTLTPENLVAGQATFTARASASTLHTIDVDLEREATAAASDYAQVATDDAKLDVVKAASLTKDEVDFVTGADDWQGFGDAGSKTPKSFGGTVSVRADQKSIRIDIKSNDVTADAGADKGGVVALTAVGTNLKFDGKDSKTFTATLDANGVGSITITPDAATIKDNSSIALSGAFAMTVNFDAPAINATEAITPSANTYVSKFGGSVEVTATVRDQYGLPVTSGFVTVERDGGVNGGVDAVNDTESAKVAVDANGQATFTLTDTKATATSKAADDLTFRYFVNDFDSTAASTATDVATVEYSADGQGADFLLQVDGVTAAGSAYDPSQHTTRPVADAVVAAANGTTPETFPSTANNDEYINLGIGGGTTGAPVTVSVDNGALVLKNAETTLAQGAASDSGVMGTDAFRVLGTKEGLTTVTVTSAGVTKTAQFTVAQDPTTTAPAPAELRATARNIAVSGPADAVSGEQITFTAVVTDAFGNGIAGFDVDDLNVQVSGPGRFQDSDAVSNANGEIKLNVSVDDDADGPITVRVKPTSTGDQFGAAANQEKVGTAANSAPGLTASTDVATATVANVTNLQALEQAVADAEAAVKAAQDALTVAQGDLAVAQARLDVANAQLKNARQDVRQAKRALKRAKRKGEGIRAARQEFRAARAERAEAKGDRNVARVARNAERTVVELEQADLAAAQAELEAAQAELDAANGEG